MILPPCTSGLVNVISIATCTMYVHDNCIGTHAHVHGVHYNGVCVHVRSPTHTHTATVPYSVTIFKETTFGN